MVVLALGLSILVIGCVPAESAAYSASYLPAETTSLTFQVREYALVEVSADNPNRPEFQQRALAAVQNQRAGWLSSGNDAFQEPNQALAPFGYHIAANPTPPFSGYALYHGNQLVERDIARFWPVAITTSKSLPGQKNFALSYETWNGEKLIANMEGIFMWPGQQHSAHGLQQPYYPGQVVYADSPSTGSEAAVATGPLPLPAGELAANVFGLQSIAGKPFYFYSSGDLVHLNYAGQDLAYVYDRVEHNHTGAQAIFNPGGAGMVAWFYALRDGLWFYVEVGMFE